MNEIKVETSFGTLVANIGGDTEYPEILVYLRREDGNELMLAAITDNTMNQYADSNDGLRIAVYDNPQIEDYSHRFVLSHDEVNNENAVWQ